MADNKVDEDALREEIQKLRNEEAELVSRSKRLEEQLQELRTELRRSQTRLHHKRLTGLREIQQEIWDNCQEDETLFDREYEVALEALRSIASPTVRVKRGRMWDVFNDDRGNQLFKVNKTTGYAVHTGVRPKFNIVRDCLFDVYLKMGSSGAYFLIPQLT